MYIDNLANELCSMIGEAAFSCLILTYFDILVTGVLISINIRRLYWREIRSYQLCYQLIQWRHRSSSQGTSLLPSSNVHSALKKEREKQTDAH